MDFPVLCTCNLHLLSINASNWNGKQEIVGDESDLFHLHFRAAIRLVDENEIQKKNTNNENNNDEKISSRIGSSNALCDKTNRKKIIGETNIIQSNRCSRDHFGCIVIENLSALYATHVWNTFAPACDITKKNWVKTFGDDIKCHTFCGYTFASSDMQCTQNM